MIKTKLKGIIFDFNGVIVDDYRLQKETWSKILQGIRGSVVADKYGNPRFSRKKALF